MYYVDNTLLKFPDISQNNNPIVRCIVVVCVLSAKREWCCSHPRDLDTTTRDFHHKLQLLIGHYFVMEGLTQQAMAETAICREEECHDSSMQLLLHFLHRYQDILILPTSNIGHLFVVGEFVVVSHLKIFPLLLLGPADKPMAGPSSSKGKIVK